MPNNTDLNNALIIPKDALVDIPVGWKDRKPSFVFIPNDGSGAQVREFQHRPVEVLIQKELPDEPARHYVEVFISALPRPLCPLISMLQLSESVDCATNWTLDVILNTPTNLQGHWVSFPKIEKDIPSETLEAMQKFLLKLTERVGPMESEPTEEECSMTLVFREAPIMGKWYRPNFNFPQ